MSVTSVCLFSKITLYHLNVKCAFDQDCFFLGGGIHNFHYQTRHRNPINNWTKLMLLFIVGIVSYLRMNRGDLPAPKKFYRIKIGQFPKKNNVVATLSFSAKMDLANLECNLKTRDSKKWPRKRWPVYRYIVGTLSKRTWNRIAKVQPILTRR